MTKKPLITKKPDLVASTPIIIRVKNLTDEKLYDVKLFDFDFQKQRKIEYVFGANKLISYEQFIHSLNHPAGSLKIGSIYLTASGDYKKFVFKQIRSEIYLINCTDGGCRSIITKYPIIDPYQLREDCCYMTDIDLDLLALSQIEFLLMPEVSVDFALYPSQRIEIATKAV